VTREPQSIEQLKVIALRLDKPSGRTSVDDPGRAWDPRPVLQASVDADGLPWTASQGLVIRGSVVQVPNGLTYRPIPTVREVIDGALSSA
jgi:hypothetical protein